MAGIDSNTNLLETPFEPVESSCDDHDIDHSHMGNGGNNVDDKLLVCLEIFHVKSVETGFRRRAGAEEESIYSSDITVG